jgi:N-acetylneuraminate synthase
MEKKNMIDLNDLKKPYLIAEIGINHNGDINITKKLIDSAFATSWDCVKFQKREPDICVPEEQKSVLRKTPWGEMTYLDYKKKIEFGRKEYNTIDDYCKQKPINWTASVWDIPSLEFILDYKVPFLKIPSAHVTNLELVKQVAKSNFPVILSTGMSTIKEIDSCVNLILKHNSNFALMHCNSSYPTPVNEINLNIINTLKKRYDCTVGYSGHEYGLEATVIAVALGAQIIERHITLDHNMWGTDQNSSIEIVGMDRLKRRIMDVSLFLGTDEKKITPSEIPIRKKLNG